MLTLKDMRYWAFRFKNEAEGGVSAEDAPEGVRELIEGHEFFEGLGGWRSFGMLWDLLQAGPDKCIITVLNKSLWDVWQEHCESVAKDFPERSESIQNILREGFADAAEIDAVLIPS